MANFKAELRYVLIERFNENELKDLCFDLEVDYESLAGNTKLDKARELIAYLERRQCIPKLVKVGQFLRSDIDWPKTSADSVLCTSTPAGLTSLESSLPGWAWVAGGLILFGLVLLGIWGLDGFPAAAEPTNFPLSTAMVKFFATTPPIATAIPDSDADGWNDLEDNCPGSQGMSQFNGCPPPLWLFFLLGALVLSQLGFIVFWLFPWVKVRSFAKPPRMYVLVCRNGKSRVIKSVYATGLGKRTNRVKIGGDHKKAHIYIQGLEPVEFIVKRQGERTVLVYVKDGSTIAFSERLHSVVRTSNSEVTLRIDADRDKLKC